MGSFSENLMSPGSSKQQNREPKTDYYQKCFIKTATEGHSVMLIKHIAVKLLSIINKNISCIE